MKQRFVASVVSLFLACSLIAMTETGTVEASHPAAGLDKRNQDQDPVAQGTEINIRGGSKVRIPDLELRDQEGRKVRFYSDLIKDKVVVLSFFYTSCTYTCTMQGRTFSKLQSLLGERLGTSVFLISVTTDPVKDTPSQLKAWGKRYDVQPGWTLVTGEAAEMNKLLVPFTGNSAGGGMHLPSTFIGNDKSGLWTSAAGVFSPEELLEVVNYLTRADTRPNFTIPLKSAVAREWQGCPHDK